MLQKRKFPKLSTQTFTDPKKRIHEGVILLHQVSSGVPRAPGCLYKSPTSKTTRPKRRGSRINRGFYCCRCSRCLQYKATVIFRSTAASSEPLLWSQKRKDARGALQDWCGPITPRSEGSWPLHLAALVQTYWHRNAGNLRQKPFLTTTGDAATDTNALKTQQHIKITFKIVKKSILTSSL